MSFENPYQAPAAAVADFPSNEPLEAADRGTRLVAVILDGLIAGGVVGILAAIAIPAVLGARRGGGDGGAILVLLPLMIFLAFLGIFVWNLVLIHKYGQTLGKRIMKVRIVRNDATRAGLGRIFWLRMFLPGVIGAIPIAGPLFSLVNICFIFRDDRRCIHDLIADTVVVKA
ncbi:MAG TPA: RDD family protein [Holophagaceae bacterium]|nr:RDD family protein [Holophagaceae bacterium]